MVTNDAGQADFIVQLGTIDIIVSGGNYNPASLTIIVNSTGVTTDNGEELPGDDNPLGSNNSIDDTIDDTIDDSEDGAGAGTGLSSGLFGEYQNVFIGIIAILVIIIVVLLSVMKLRGRDKNDWEAEEAWNDYEDIISSPAVYEYETPATNATSKVPPNYIEGQWRDGYEVLEYPSGSGEWWYKDGQSGQWMEWK